MVTKYRIIVFFIFLSFSNIANARSITRITISESGKSEHDSVSSACEKFQPTIKQVRLFFSKAYPVESYIRTTERYSPCYAAGTIKFSDNSEGEWWLNSGGAASLTFSRGDNVKLLYKNNKWFDPFACMYGLSSEGEC